MISDNRAMNIRYAVSVDITPDDLRTIRSKPYGPQKRAQLAAMVAERDDCTLTPGLMGWGPATHTLAVPYLGDGSWYDDYAGTWHVGLDQKENA